MGKTGRSGLICLARAVFGLGLSLSELELRAELETLPTPMPIHDFYSQPLDAELDPAAMYCDEQPPAGYGYPWTWQVLPDGLIYRSYLAGVKESRMASAWVYERDFGWFLDATVGGRIGVLRYGSLDDERPEGWQFDVEAAAFPRLDWDDDLDLISSDFRYGFPLTYGTGPWEVKLAHYHLSSHLGDEFILENGIVERINFARDVVVFGLGYHFSDDVRVYGEAGYAFRTSGGSEPWEFQFGIEYAPLLPGPLYGSPFAAANAHLREEVGYGGSITLQTGYQWRGSAGHLLRVGVQYYNGKSPQFEFFEENEEQFAVALWYDY